jgi:RNA polymerase sigma-70 factor (ECF subfamily)
MTLEQVYEEQFDFVWRSLRRLGVRDEDVPDALQDVFLVVYRGLDGFEGRSKLTTWLFGIAWKVASARRRNGHARRELASDPDTLEQPDPAPDAFARVSHGQGLELLESLLAEMPEEQRVVFMLFELEEMSGDEIAAIVGAPVGTVRSRLRLARECFRRSLERLHARAPRRNDREGALR